MELLVGGLVGWLVGGCCCCEFLLVIIVLENPWDCHVDLCSDFSENMAAG
jgi:hypothetical protein